MRCCWVPVGNVPSFYTIANRARYVYNVINGRSVCSDKWIFSASKQTHCEQVSCWCCGARLMLAYIYIAA
jgi:hypothetical protein